MDFDIVKSKNSFDKIRVNISNLCETLNYLKTNAKYAYDRLTTIIAVDLGVEKSQIELIYDLYSTSKDKCERISLLVDRNSPHAPSIVDIYKSAYFDECEIFDMFGVVFDNNPDLKRLLMPKGWVGNPLRKDYVQNDERIQWND